MDQPDSFDHLSTDNHYSWRNIFGQSDLNEAMDRMDGVVEDASRDSPEPVNDLYHELTAEAVVWTAASVEFPSSWEQDLSGGEFGMGESAGGFIDFRDSSSASTSPLSGGSVEMDHTYASPEQPNLPQETQLSSQTVPLASSSSEDESAEHSELVVDFVTNRNTDASTSSQVDGSEWGSTSAVASVTSDYQHAPLSPEYTPVRSHWAGSGARRRISQSPPLARDPEDFISAADYLDHDMPVERPASPEIPVSSDVWAPSRHWTRQTALRSSFARHRTPPVAAPSPPPLPPRPTVRATTTVPARASLSTYFSALQSATTSLAHPERRSGTTTTVGRAFTLMPFYEGRTGSVTLSAYPPATAAPAIVEELTQMTKKRISPQVRKVMGKLGMELGEARSSRAMTPDPCSICFELPTIANASLAYPCLHAFCDACISEWVKTKSSCPNCQAACTKILYNLRAELDYDFKEVPNRNTLAHPAAYDGDLLQFFIHMSHRRDRDASRQTAALRASLLTNTGNLRGNPYTNRTPVREFYQVAAIFSRSFQDIPSAMDQEHLLPNYFEVCRVSFRRRVYAEPLNGAMEARAAPSAFVAPLEIGRQITGDSGFHGRFMPWLRREVLAVLTPEASNTQKEQLYQTILGLFRSTRSVLRASFIQQVSAFILSDRVTKFWEQMVQFLQHRFAMGVWDGAMRYYDGRGVQVPASAADETLAVRSRSGVTRFDINVYSDDEDTVGASSTHSSFPNEDPDDSDGSVQFLSVQRRGRPMRRAAPLIILSSDDEAEATVGVPTPQTVSAQTSPLVPPTGAAVPNDRRNRNPLNFSPRFFPDSPPTSRPSPPPNYSPDLHRMYNASPDYVRSPYYPMAEMYGAQFSPARRSEAWSEEMMGQMSPPIQSPREPSWERESNRIDSVMRSLASVTGREEVVARTRRLSGSLQRREAREARYRSRRSESRARGMRARRAAAEDRSPVRRRTARRQRSSSRHRSSDDRVRRAHRDEQEEARRRRHRDRASHRLRDARDAEAARQSLRKRPVDSRRL